MVIPLHMVTMNGAITPSQDEPQSINVCKFIACCIYSSVFLSPIIWHTDYITICCSLCLSSDLVCNFLWTQNSVLNSIRMKTVHRRRLNTLQTNVWQACLWIKCPELSFWPGDICLSCCWDTLPLLSLSPLLWF